MGVVKVIRKNVGRTLTVSSELVPFQEIDVFAKESGFVKDLNVDYGSRVQKDQVLATLEIPELQLQVKEDDAAVKNARGPNSACPGRVEPRAGPAEGAATAV